MWPPTRHSWPPSCSVLQGRGFGQVGYPLECAAAKVCREVGARVTPNAFVRDLDLGAFNVLDGRRIEVIADGLTLWQGAQLAIDTTLVSPLRRDGTPRRGAARGAGFGGSAPKERVHSPSAAGGVGGRNRGSMVSQDGPFAKAKAETAPLLMQKRVQGAWLRRWAPSWRAAQAGRSLCLFLTGGQTQARGPTSLRSMRWCGMTVSLDGLLREPAEVACTCDFLVY